MTLIKVRDLAWARMRAPDLDAMEEFLTHFGLTRAARTPTALFMRGTDPVHHIHVTEKADDAGFVGFAYHATSEADLARVAAAPGASAVEALDEPGGGKRVRLHEPNGYQVEVIWGLEEPIKRIGHGVMGTPKVRETVQWFRDTLGFIGSDDVYAGQKDNLIGSFNRCDRGEEYVDHHTLFCVHNERAGLNHVSFEVPDVDAVFKDHEYLAGLGKYEHMWGVGRHLLGSQVYDYWSDPWGRVHERWADTDRLNARSGSNLLSAEEALVSQWGEDPPERFIRHVTT